MVKQMVETVKTEFSRMSENEVGRDHSLLLPLIDYLKRLKEVCLDKDVDRSCFGCDRSSYKSGWMIVFLFWGGKNVMC